MTRRLTIALVVLVAAASAGPAFAQAGRASGVVRDQKNQPIRGAIVRAENPAVKSKPIAATTDDKGRWAMIGLTSATWHFVVEAPGYAPVSIDLPIRLTGTAPMSFTLARDLGPLPGALDKNIAQLVAEAGVLREQGKLDQAIAAYADIRSRNAKLTAVNLPLADTYRRKAAQQTDPAARRATLERAAEAYDAALAGDADNEFAKSGLAATRAELAAITNR